jgi:uncharacterized membrane protein
MLLSLTLAVSLTGVVFLLLIIFAAYSDMTHRGCPEAVQCEDAMNTIKVGVVLLMACVAVAVAGVALFLRTKRNNSKRSPEK